VLCHDTPRPTPIAGRSYPGDPASPSPRHGRSSDVMQASTRSQAARGCCPACRTPQASSGTAHGVRAVLRRRDARRRAIASIAAAAVMARHSRARAAPAVTRRLMMSSASGGRRPPDRHSAATDRGRSGSHQSRGRQDRSLIVCSLVTGHVLNGGHKPARSAIRVRRASRNRRPPSAPPRRRDGVVTWRVVLLGGHALRVHGRHEISLPPGWAGRGELRRRRAS
jgi:hypothetical protein